MGYYDELEKKDTPFSAHYISAYGLAVKHGYKGTEEENDIARKEVLENKQAVEQALSDAQGILETANTTKNAVDEAKTTAKTAAENAKGYANLEENTGNDNNNTYTD